MSAFGNKGDLIKDHEITVGVLKKSVEATESISPILPRQSRQSQDLEALLAKTFSIRLFLACANASLAMSSSVSSSLHLPKLPFPPQILSASN